jgi:hypothetical protein
MRWSVPQPPDQLVAYELLACWQPIPRTADSDASTRCILNRSIYGMLKITHHTSSDSRHLTLEGRLIGPWVLELEQAWHSIKQSGEGMLVVDLTGVTFIEEKGKHLLSRMWLEGAELIATGCCNRSIVEQITGSTPYCSSDQQGRK